MVQFKQTKRIKVSPYSKYYAIESLNEELDNIPLLIIVDPVSDPQIVVSSARFSKSSVTAVVIPHLSVIDRVFCLETLNVIDDSPIELYELPLVAKGRGSARENSATIKIFQ